MDIRTPLTRRAEARTHHCIAIAGAGAEAVAGPVPADLALFDAARRLAAERTVAT